MNQTVKQFISYVIYVIIIGYLLIRVDDFQRYLENLYSTTYNVKSLWVFMSIYPILVGILLALPHFISTLKHKGPRKYDWVLLLAVGLPALFIAFTPIISMLQLQFTNKYCFFIMALHPNLITIAGIVFGYVLLSSLGKLE